MMYITLILNLVASFILCGLIWVVQLVQYPMFHRLEREQFTDHIHFHGQKTSILVVPLMITELITSGLLALFAPTYRWVHIAGFVIVIAIWISTFLLQVPLHNQLSKKRDSDRINQLISTNAIRTALWTLKALLGTYLLYEITAFV